MSARAHAQQFAPPTDLRDGRRNLVGLSRDELTEELAGLGEPAFRARQLWGWIYQRGATRLRRDDLAGQVPAGPSGGGLRGRAAPRSSLAQTSADGTRKWLLRFPDGQEVESVHIPEAPRGTLCVSSQVGCTLTCRFCHTGTQRLVRNLSAAEIVGQVLNARDAFGEWPRPDEGRQLTNIVMMGMGEPLYNYDNVAKALEASSWTARAWRSPSARSRSRPPASCPAMQRCGEELGVNLAVSLHAVTDELRDELVPLNKKYPLKELLAACRAYPGVHNARRITFEYVMLKGVNDSPADAREMARLLKGIPAKINLIPFNPWPGAPYACSPPAAVELFSDILADCGLTAPVRQPRGQDIMAACGQLKSASQRLKKAERAASSLG